MATTIEQLSIKAEALEQEREALGQTILEKVSQADFKNIFTLPNHILRCAEGLRDVSTEPYKRIYLVRNGSRPKEVRPRQLTVARKILESFFTYFHKSGQPDRLAIKIKADTAGILPRYGYIGISHEGTVFVSDIGTPTKRPMTATEAIEMGNQLDSTISNENIRKLDELVRKAKKMRWGSVRLRGSLPRRRKH